jgi:hypothetical protein
MPRFKHWDERLPLTSWMTLGAGLMYLLDPDGGKRRRALVRDKLFHLVRVGRLSADRAKRDLANRAHGMRARLEGHSHWSDQVPDEILSERVRSKMGVFVSHPHAVEVHVENGVVTLSGPILRREAPPFVRRVRHMAGVRHVLDRLDRHSPDDNVSALQGGVPRHRRPEFLQNNWAPGARLLAGAAGAALFVAGRSRHYRPLALLGSALLLRSAANMPLKSVATTVKNHVFGKRGRARVELEPIPPVTPVQSPAEPTPTERAQDVLRSIRD